MNDAPATTTVHWLMAETHCSEHAARQAVAYIAAQQAAIGAVPTQTEVVFERFFDDSGGMQLVVHAPFGGRINRAWGLAMRKRFCRSFDFELQATADDDGFILSLGPQHSFPIEALFPMLRPDNVRNLLEQALLVLPLFHLRWRWNVSRSLQLERMRNGRKVPPALQRFRAEDLLTAVFPKLTGCQEEHTGDHVIPDHPLVQQTVEDCLFEALDLEALLEILAKVERGEITFVARDTREPSPFAYELLNANPYAFLDGGEVQERRTRMVETQRTLTVESVRDLGRLDPAAIATVVDEARPLVRDADELHDLLLTRYLLPECMEASVAGRQFRGKPEAVWEGEADLQSSWVGLLESLVAERRAARVEYLPGCFGWIAAERWPAVQTLFPAAIARPDLTAPTGITPPADSVEVRVALLRGWMETAGPVTAGELGRRLGLAPAAVFAALEALEGEGCVLRGQFRTQSAAPVEVATSLSTGDHELASAETSATPPASIEWCHRRLLQQIHRLTVSGLRREIEPVAVADYWRYLIRRQGLVGDSRPTGPNGLYEVIGQLQGLDLPAIAWEQEILPRRVSGYRRDWLDELCLNGEVGWGRLYPPARDPEKSRPMASLTRNVPVSLFLREDQSWLADGGQEVDVGTLSSVGKQVLELLARRGAMFTTDVLSAAQLLPGQLDDVLGELVARGLVTADGFAGLRGLVRDREPEASTNPDRRRPKLVRHRRAAVTAGRWSLWRSTPVERPVDGESIGQNAASDTPAEARSRRREHLEHWAWQLLRRWGVVFRDLLTKEPGAPAWWELLPTLRRLEMRGEIRGGRFILGVGGEQYASGEVVQQLRQLRQCGTQSRQSSHATEAPPEPDLMVLSAADPLNLTGILTSHARVPALVGHRVVYHRGTPVADVQAGRLTIYAECPEGLRGDIALATGIADEAPATATDEEYTDRHARRFASRKPRDPDRPRFPRPLIS